MPWEERSVTMMREQFVNEVLTGEKNKSQLCREYGISRVTGDKWLVRYQNGESFEDRSRSPFHTPNKTPSEMEKLILSVRNDHPAWGARKILAYLLRREIADLPGRSTIDAILRRNGCITEQASRAATPFKRFQRETCNELWQTDFKGDFAMLDGQRCFPLTVLDDCSRFSLCIDAKNNIQREGVLTSFERIFKTYGIPDTILCDNGNPWGNSQTTGYTKFEIWMMDRDILIIHGCPKHPQTQGKEERFHRTMKRELLDFTSVENMVHAQMLFDQFRSCYNQERPHEALDMRVPADIYHTSRRALPEIIREWEYGSEFVLRKVKETGYLTYANRGYFLSEALGGKIVGLRESHLEGQMTVYYRNFKIARLDPREKAFTSRHVYRDKAMQP